MNTVIRTTGQPYMGGFQDLSDGRLIIPSWFKRFLMICGAIAILRLTLDLVTATALGSGDVPSEQPQFALSTDQLYAALIGALTPLVGYVLNYFAPWVTDKTKGLVQIGLVTFTGALYAVLESGTDLFSEQTLQLVMTAFFAAFIAHTAAWKPTHLSTTLGAGRNVQDKNSMSADDHDHLNVREVG